MLVDLGSRVNSVGANTEREFSLEADMHNLNTSYERRKHRLNANGVGVGSAPCDEETTLPVAIEVADQIVVLDSFKANLAKASGADLPAILGSQSMQDKDSVTILRKRKR